MSLKDATSGEANIKGIAKDATERGAMWYMVNILKVYRLNIEFDRTISKSWR